MIHVDHLNDTFVSQMFKGLGEKMIRSLMIAISFLGPVSSYAQTTTLPIEEVKKEEQTNAPKDETKTPPPPAEPKAERMEITGSHIKRIDTEGASPVQTITRKQLDDAAVNSVGDVLRGVSANTFGSLRETNNSNAAGNAEVDLRGLGSSNSLVLLNGQRLPTDAITGAVDLNLIPEAAVERIEILKDGASAIYGSDALGGVVNIITRKDFNGSQVTTSQSTPEQRGGRRNDVSLVNGFNEGRLNMINIIQYRDNQPVYSRDRSWSNNGISNIGAAPAYRSGDGPSHVLSCPPDQIKHTADGDVCSFKYSDYSAELPELKQFSMMSESNVEVNSKVKMTARIMGGQREVTTQLAPAPGNFTLKGGSLVDQLGPGGTQLPGTTSGQDLTISLRNMSGGNRENHITSYNVNALVGATIETGKNWNVEITASQNDVQTNNLGVNGYALTSAMQGQIQAGCSPFDPARPCNFQNVQYTPQESTRSQLSSLDAKTSGELAKFNDSSMGLALGASTTYAKYIDSFDDQSVNGGVFGNAGSSGRGDRSTRSAYSELSIPIFPKVELQLAERFDHYSDFGDTANPKAGLSYKLSKTVLLRGSAGTGFKAPLMQDLYAAKSIGYPSFIDHVACDAERKAGGDTSACAPQQYQVTSAGNKDLHQETSQAYSLGTVFEPTKEFNISSDFFWLRNHNVVGIDYEDLTLAQAQGIDPRQYGVTVTRDAQGNILNIDAPLQNLSEQQVAGFDISTGYVFKRVRVGVEHAQMFYFKEQGFPGLPFRNKLGEHGRPPWRNTVAVAYRPADRHDVTLAAQTTASQEKTIPEMGRMGIYTQYDVLYSYKSKSLGTFIAGVKNVFGTTPPLDDSDPTGQLNTTIYDQIGRQYYTGYKATF